MATLSTCIQEKATQSRGEAIQLRSHSTSFVRALWITTVEVAANTVSTGVLGSFECANAGEVAVRSFVSPTKRSFGRATV